MTTTWDSIRSQVREAKFKLHLNLSKLSNFQIDLDKGRVYFIGVNRPFDANLSPLVNRGSAQLYYTNWDSHLQTNGNFKKDYISVLNGENNSIKELTWEPLITTSVQHLDSTNEQLTIHNLPPQQQFENLLDYKFYPPNLILLEFLDKIVEFNLSTQKFRTLLEGTNLEAKLGGKNNELISYLKPESNDLFVRKRDLKGEEINLTKLSNISSDIYAGKVDYILKEEFNLNTGYHWQPSNGIQQETSNNFKNRILYKYTDETSVNLVKITGENGTKEELNRYPLPNTPNAYWELRVVEFSSEDSEIINPITHSLSKQSPFFPPWTEYLVRFGWLPAESNGIWCQVLSRDQQKSQILEISLNSIYNQDPTVNILFEDNSTPWVNITDLHHFYKDSSNSLVMIWSGEQSGYRHLYKITKLSQSTKLERLTSGDWSVLDHQIFIDKIRGLVYFIGNRDNSIESHLYVTTLNANSDQILRLTTLGNSYKIQLNISKGIGVMMFSNLSTPVKTQLFQLQFKDQNAIFPILVPLSEFASSPVPMKSFLPKVEPFQFSNTVGVTLNGLIFKPSQLELSENLRLDYQFSTLLYVYGGPKSQLVTNEFQYQKLIRCYLACQLGYIVVVIDGRGTANRGLEFESKIYGELGDCELEDQVEGLNHLINKTPIGKFINRQRIAITGWSYGGYLSLMAMVKYSDIFKLCISGAPVVDWEYYDNAYTERYLGFPDKNPQGYKKSSILNYVESFPNEENRVLICHGMMDNNVHFSHTEKLINSLIKYNKPYQLQIFPNERHGLKEPNSLDHFDTLMFYWLKNYL